MTFRSFLESLGMIAATAVIIWVVLCGDNGLKKCQERYSKSTCIHNLR